MSLTLNWIDCEKPAICFGNHHLPRWQFYTKNLVVPCYIDADLKEVGFDGATLVVLTGHFTERTMKGMIAGPFGFLLGLIIGFGTGVLVALNPYFTLPWFLILFQEILRDEF